MKNEEELRREIRDALDAIRRPAPGLLDAAMARVRAESGLGRRRVRGWALQIAGTLLAAAVVGALAVALQQSRSQPIVGSRPPVQSPADGVPRLEPGAQVAWLDGRIGVDQSGHILGPIDGTDAVRSPDGGHLYAIAGHAVAAYSALTGQRERTIVTLTAAFVDPQLRTSSDGRYLGLLETSETSTAVVEMIDVGAGRSAGRLDLGIASPRGAGLLMLAPDARQLYVFSDLSHPSSVLVISFDGTSLQVTRRASDGMPGHTIPACSGLFIPTWSPGGLPVELLPDRQTIALYCPSDGRVSWFDLSRLTISGEQVQVDLPNPFWLSPAFSPDGAAPYLQEGFSGRGGLQVVDLVQRKIVMSTKQLAQSVNPLRWLVDRLVTPVYAGGTLRTAAVSPDDSRLYLVGEGGVHVYQLPDRRQIAVWLPAPSVWFSGDGPSAGVWVSGDSRTVYVLGRDQRVYVIRAADGVLVASTPPGRQVSGDFLVFSP